MNNVLFSTVLAFAWISNAVAQGQIIPLTIDSTQSAVEISIGGSQDNSQLSGTITLDVQSSNPPSGNAQITSLDLVLEESLSFSLFLGVSGSTSAGEVTFSLVTPGAPGMLLDNRFDQLGNLFEFSGELNVSDPFGIAGGSQTVDLATIDLGPTDLNSISVTQTGNVITVSGGFTASETLEAGGGVPVVINATYVATGVVPAPVLKGDVNANGVVDFADIPAFIAVLQNGNFQSEADCDCSSAIDFADIPAFIAILQGS